MSGKYLIKVAVGIIFNAKNEVLITQRPQGKSYSGFWEFPGGKIEKKETVFQALQRELLEETGIKVIAANAWQKLRFTYPDCRVLLHIWRVTQFSGEPVGLESQLVQWVSLNHLDQFQFLAANKKILDALFSLNHSSVALQN